MAEVVVEKDINTVKSGDGTSEHNLPDLNKLELGLSSLINKMDFDRPNDNELRILIFTATYFVLDGVTLTIRRLEAHLRSKGAIVKILSTVPDDCSDISPDHLANVIVVPGIKIPFTNAGTGYAFGTGMNEAVLNEIEKFSPNVIHFTVPDFVALDGIRYCQRKNIAYIATWHSNYCDYLKYYFLEWVLGPAFHRYLNGFFEQVPAVYVPTPYMLKRMESWGYGRCSELKEWGRGIDLELFKPQRRSQVFRQSKNISPTDIVVLWVGRLVPEKRPDIWLNVIKKLQKEGLPVKAMVVGNGTFEKTLSQINNVVCCGWLSGAALAEAYASADVLLFPSDVETFGNVTLEALASGCPCVVEDKCGGHLVDYGFNGFTCPAGNFDSFYQATRKIVVDLELRTQLCKNARESSWKFDRNKIMQQMAENYKDAIMRHRDPDYIKRYMQSSPEAEGKNFLSFICCNYWAVKTFAEPFLNTSLAAQNFVYGTTECVQQSRTRLNCADSSFVSAPRKDSHDQVDSKYEGEKKGKLTSMFSVNTWIFLGKLLHYLTIIVSFGIVLLFFAAQLTV
jgi:glycosyltransferase involved in cell wall biosynthesis